MTTIRLPNTVTLSHSTIAFDQAGTGPPLLLVHGFPTSGFLFHRLMPLLAPHFTVYALDLLGYGRSQVLADAALDLNAQVAMIGEFADAYDLKPFTLVGHDLGGGIGQIIGLRHPEWVQRMVWINSVAAGNFPIRRIQALLAALAVPGVDWLLANSPLLRWWAYSPWGLRAGVSDRAAFDEDAIDEMVGRPFLRTRARRTHFIRVARTQRRNARLLRDLAPDLDKLRTPTRLLWGDADRFLPPRWADHLERVVPGIAGWTAIPGAGHFCPLEQPALIADHILRFAGPTSSA